MSRPVNSNALRNFIVERLDRKVEHIDGTVGTQKKPGVERERERVAPEERGR